MENLSPDILLKIVLLCLFAIGIFFLIIGTKSRKVNELKNSLEKLKKDRKSVV